LKMAAEKTQRVVLTIAGSDPSGGAGIQADLKTFTAVGVYGGAAITSLTVQNTQGVFAVHPLDPALVRDQVGRVLDDLDVSHIKIGMLGSGAVAQSVCTVLADFRGEIICDPVLVSSGGRQLIDQEGSETVRTQLLKLCTVLTPNIPELKLLTDVESADEASLAAAAETLLHRYGRLRSVIVTGGHREPASANVTDCLFSLPAGSVAVSCEKKSHPRVKSRNTHGTGCTFAAAFTAYHFLTGSDREAFQRAVEFMGELVRKSARFKVGHGTGPLLHHLA
jgi:hydroxymethylpyrimidine/phosphomethylpyrimidine kinase